MAEQLADLRTNITDLNGAKLVFAELGALEAALAERAARLEKTIKQAREYHERGTADIRARAEDLRSDLLRFIIRNKNLFRKPRKIKTDIGTFGLHTASKIKITDADKLVEWLEQNGFEDCYKVVKKPIKEAIHKRYDEGDKIPFITASTGDLAVYTIKKEIIKEAKERGLKNETS